MQTSTAYSPSHPLYSFTPGVDDEPNEQLEQKQ